MRLIDELLGDWPENEWVCWSPKFFTSDQAPNLRVEDIKMREIMTITLSNNKPGLKSDNGYVAGDQVSIFFDEASGTFGYHYHGVSHSGSPYQSKKISGFETQQAATKEAIENYRGTGLGC